MCSIKKKQTFLLVALCFLDAFFYLEQALASSVVLDGLAASVNSVVIFKSDIQKFEKTLALRKQIDTLFQIMPAVKKPIEYLIDEKIILAKYPVTDEKVESVINSIQSDNKIDRNALKAALKSQGHEFEDYFNITRCVLSKRELIEKEIRNKITVSENDIKEYFYEHYVKNTTLPRAFHLQIISLSHKNYKNPKAAYSFATDSLKSLKSGEPFEEVAKRVSDDPSGPAGGDLGILTEDQITPTIRKQLKNLQIGQVSEVFGDTSLKFYYILKLKDIESSATQKLEKMREKIKNQVIAREYQQQISIWLERQKLNISIYQKG